MLCAAGEDVLELLACIRVRAIQAESERPAWPWLLYISNFELPRHQEDSIRVSVCELCQKVLQLEPFARQLRWLQFEPVAAKKEHAAGLQCARDVLRARQDLGHDVSRMLRRADVPQQHASNADNQRHQSDGFHNLRMPDIFPVLVELLRRKVDECRRGA